MKLNFVIKIWEGIKNWWPRTWKEASSLLSSLVFQAVYYAFVIGLIGYLIHEVAPSHLSLPQKDR